MKLVRSFEIPFSSDQFFEVFRSYNAAIFPVQFILLFLAAFLVVLVLIPAQHYSKAIHMILAILWLWTGIVYHLMFFTSINTLAYVFAALFILQALVFVYFGVIRDGSSFAFSRDIYSLVGGACIFYAIAIYPLMGWYFGHVYPASPTFGAPCPTTIFTFGLLMFSTQKLRLYIYCIPLLWSLIAATAAIQFDVWEDLGLVVAGIACSVMLYRKRFESRPNSAVGGFKLAIERSAYFLAVF